MARENFRKVKLLKLLEMLQLGSDEQHPLTTSHITARLEQMGIPCDRRTLAQDIALLTELDYEIMTTTVGHEKGYYVEDRNFSIPELKILIDAVHASSFITEKKSDELIGKIAALAGSHRAEVLKRGMVAFNTRKHSNEKIFYNVDRLEKAILCQKQVSFQYFDLNEAGEKVYRREGSPGRREMARIQKEEDSVEATVDGVLFADEIKGKSTLQDLIANLCRSFEEHYGRIAKYKENLYKYGLIDESTTIKTMFLVEDVSPLGSIVINHDSKQQPLIVLLHRGFLDLFKVSTDLDYVLACSSAGDRNFVWFADRCDIDEYYNHSIDYEKMIFLDFNVQVLGFKIAIPREHKMNSDQTHKDFEI